MKPRKTPSFIRQAVPQEDYEGQRHLWVADDVLWVFGWKNGRAVLFEG